MRFNDYFRDHKMMKRHAVGSGSEEDPTHSGIVATVNTYIIEMSNGSD